MFSSELLLAIERFTLYVRLPLGPFCRRSSGAYPDDRREWVFACGHVSSRG